MTKATTAATILISLATLATPATRIIPADEIISRARWGMTQAQVLRDFSGEAASVPPRRVYSFHGAQDRLAAVGIPFARLEQVPCTVVFLFDDEGRLDGILFASDSSQPQSYERFLTTEAMLSQRYGEPTRSSKVGSQVGFRSIWLQKDAVSELTFVYPSLFLMLDKRTSQTKQSMMADWTEVHGPHRLPGVSQPPPPHQVLTDPNAPPVKATISNQ